MGPQVELGASAIWGSTLGRFAYRDNLLTEVAQSASYTYSVTRTETRGWLSGNAVDNGNWPLHAIRNRLITKI
jgi:hypothetical protein